MSFFKIGVTGTRQGCSEKQKFLIMEFLRNYRGIFLAHNISLELHHGDCVGVDGEVADMAKELGIRTVCHPPLKKEFRYFHDSTEIRKPAGYLKRDRNIVNEVHRLLVVPLELSRQDKGGTWYTYDYAVELKKPIAIIWRTGEYENKNT